MTEREAHELYALLGPGDLRTTGAADRVAGLIADDPAAFNEVLAGLHATAAGLRMRCADAVEKASRARPERLVPHREQLVRLLLTSGVPEVQWHLAQMLTRLALDDEERRACAVRLTTLLECSGSRIVRTEALDALVRLAAQDERLAATAQEALARALADPAPAVAARARSLTRRSRSTDTPQERR